MSDPSDCRINDITEELRLVHKRISVESDKYSENFKELTKKQDSLLASLNEILVPIGVMGNQVERNEADIKQMKIDNEKDIDELKGIMDKWEARIFKFLIGIVSSIVLTIIGYFMAGGTL